MSRVQISRIPNTPCLCSFGAPYLREKCIYQDGQGVCGEPRTNKGNGDAGCYNVSNKLLMWHLKKVLTKIKSLAVPSGVLNFCFV